MKMDNKRYQILKDAINKMRCKFPDYNPSYVKDPDRARRWGYFFAARFELRQDDTHPVFSVMGRERTVERNPNYDDADLDDEHIDTALRQIFAESPE